MYLWRKLTPSEREELLKQRQLEGHPWHKPNHEGGQHASYHLIAACFEHKPLIGSDAKRVGEFEQALLDTLKPVTEEIHAWCVLPNHYHVLLTTVDMLYVTKRMGRFHGSLSFQWNGEDNTRGRQIWCGCTDRRIRSERHFWATMNYVHNNPVRHGHVLK